MTPRTNDSSDADSAGVPVLFRMQADHLNATTTVHLVGEFNGWSPTATPMTRSGNECIAAVTVVPGRTYRYKFLVAGTQWENDWHADAYVPNEFGGEDSLLDLTNHPVAEGGEPQPEPASTPDRPEGDDADSAPRQDDPDSPGAAIDDTEGTIPEPNEPG